MTCLHSYLVLSLTKLLHGSYAGCRIYGRKNTTDVLRVIVPFFWSVLSYFCFDALVVAL